MTDSLENFRNAWRQTGAASVPPADSAEVQRLIQGRIRAEQRSVGKYIWASGVWQLMIYITLIHLTVRFWHDPVLPRLCLSGVLLYLPFSYLFFTKFKQYTLSRSYPPDPSGQPLVAYVRRQYRIIHSFFRFKQWFEAVAVPLTSGLLVLLAVRFGWLPNPRQNPLPGLMLFAVALTAFSVAILHENKYRFRQPLNQLTRILTDLESGDVQGA